MTLQSQTPIVPSIDKFNDHGISIVDKLLQQFLEVATSKNLSQAAKRLFISQPTLTHNMQRLEASLGIELFTRSSTGITLTESGVLLHDQARIMQRIYEQTLHKLEFIKKRSERGLRIGSGHAWWHPLLRHVLQQYRQSHSAASLNVDLGNHLRLLDMLLNGDIDLFIGHEIHGLTHKSGLLFVPLFLSNDDVFVREGHPLLGKPCRHSDLLNYPSLLVTPDENRYLHLVDDLHPKQQQRSMLQLNEKIIYTSNSIMVSLDIIRDTNAVMPYPRCMSDYFRGFGIQALEMVERYNKGIVGIYLPGETADDPHIAQILTLIRDQVNRQSSLVATF